MTGHWMQLCYQLADSVSGFAYSFGGSCIILFLINLIPGLGLRASEEAEVIGMDDAEIGEFAVSGNIYPWRTTGLLTSSSTTLSSLPVMWSMAEICSTMNPNTRRIATRHCQMRKPSRPPLGMSIIDHASHVSSWFPWETYLPHIHPVYKVLRCYIGAPGVIFMARRYFDPARIRSHV